MVCHNSEDRDGEKPAASESGLFLSHLQDCREHFAFCLEECDPSSDSRSSMLHFLRGEAEA